MQRKWYVWAHPETGAVEREDLIGALLDAAAILDRIGGVISVVQERRPTGAPGEMRSVVTVVEWKDRTDAKPQPEETVAVAPAVDPTEPEPMPEPDGETGGEVAEPRAWTPFDGTPEPDPIGDGLDPATLEDEDLSSVPEHAR